MDMAATADTAAASVADLAVTAVLVVVVTILMAMALMPATTSDGLRVLKRKTQLLFANELPKCIGAITRTTQNLATASQVARAARAKLTATLCSPSYIASSRPPIILARKRGAPLW